MVSKMEMIHGLKYKLYMRKKVKTRLESKKKKKSYKPYSRQVAQFGNQNTLVLEFIFFLNSGREPKHFVTDGN